MSPFDPGNSTQRERSGLPGDDTNNHGSMLGPIWKDERQSVTTFSQLSPKLVHDFLASVDYLHGVCVDSNGGPRRIPVQVASFKAGKHPHIRETSDINTELPLTYDEREANYEHHGWWTSALHSLSPWTQLRISNNNHSRPSQYEPSVTRRMIVCRLQVELLQQDLAPMPEFQIAVQEALGKGTRSEKFQAIYQIFDHWGDVIPLAFDLGASLTITDSKLNYEANPIDLSSHQAIEHRTAKILTQGIDPGALRQGLDGWLYKSEVPIGQWARVRVTKAAPVTNLLSEELRTQLLDLHGSMISYNPLVFKEEIGGETASGHLTCAAKLVKSVILWTGKRANWLGDTGGEQSRVGHSWAGEDHIHSLRTIYCDGTASTEYGKCQGSKNTFTLTSGDCITHVIVWKRFREVYAIQFFTRNGLASGCYGGGGGTPVVINGDGQCLVGLVAAVIESDQDEYIHKIQGHWCEAIQHESLGVQWGFSQYHGDESGARFDDWALIGGLTSTFVTSIKVIAGSFDSVDGIQLTYSCHHNSGTVNLEGFLHGGNGDVQETVQMGPGEYIISVGGKIKNYITQLNFTTNLGRKWAVSGRAQADKEFLCNAPLGVDGQPMRLHSIVGRGHSGGFIAGILCVWSVI